MKSISRDEEATSIRISNQNKRWDLLAPRDGVKMEQGLGHGRGRGKLTLHSRHFEWNYIFKE